MKQYLPTLLLFSLSGANKHLAPKLAFVQIVTSEHYNHRISYGRYRMNEFQIPPPFILDPLIRFFLSS